MPGAFLLVGYLNMADTLTFKARLNGDRVSQYIYTHDNLWQYQQVRLVEQIKLPMSDEESVQQKIYTKDDKLVLEDGPPLEAPVITRRAAIVVTGTTARLYRRGGQFSRHTLLDGGSPPC